MSEYSAQTYKWVDENILTISSAIGLGAKQTDDDVAKFMKLLSKRDKNRAAYAALLEVANSTNAPASVQKELKGLSQNAAAYWKTLGPKDEASLPKLLGQFQKAKTAAPVIKSVILSSAGGGLKPAVAANITERTALAFAKNGPLGAPWWCYVCFTVPIWGLICVLIKSCRGGSSNETLNHL